MSTVNNKILQNVMFQISLKINQLTQICLTHEDDLTLNFNPFSPISNL